MWRRRGHSANADTACLLKPHRLYGLAMKLEEFRKAEKLSKTALADLLGIKGAGRARTVQRYIDGLRFPERSTITLIAEKTGGKVTWADWAPSLQEPRRSADTAAKSIAAAA